MLSLTLTACSAGPPVAPDAPVGVVEALDGARANAMASPDQIATLEATTADGRDVTEGEHRAAFNATAECARDAGINVTGITEYQNAGVLSLPLAFTGELADEDANLALISACEQTHSRYIDSAVNNEQAIREAASAIIADYLPALRECVRERGYDVAPDAPYEEVSTLDVAANEAQGTETGCIESTGLNEAIAGPQQ